ncbi:MAG: twin-arginine translocase subunit TatC [Nitriliruptorales bacterium]|nr:twin-arginine translocase subunit TatC [Nitriliruptorales bacterium]
MTATASRGRGVPTPDDPKDHAGGEMTLFEHLEELRQRLFKSAVAVALGFVVGFMFRQQVLDLLTQPYCALDPRLRAASNAVGSEECKLIFIDVTGAFFISLKAAAIVAVVLAAPVVLYQLWRFITPGLRPVERRYAIPFVLVTYLLFSTGAVASYFVIPEALQFLLGFAGDRVESLMDADRYLSFVLQSMIGFGLAFEFPVVLVIMSLMGVITSAGMRRYRRHAIFGVFVAAAIITPGGDPLTMTLMAAPLLLFYEGSILFARVIERRRRGSAVAS